MMHKSRNWIANRQKGKSHCWTIEIMVPASPGTKIKKISTNKGDIQKLKLIQKVFTNLQKEVENEKLGGYIKIFHGIK